MDTVAQGWGGFELVSQKGSETGNDEEQTYTPDQCQVRGTSMFLVLSRGPDGWLSGKIRSKQNLTQMCNGGNGELECVVQGPNLQFYDGRRCFYSHGIWSAVWLLPDCSKIPWPQGSETDLLELMHKTYDDCHKGFSTLHFGPRRGRDYDTPRRWGLPLGSYVWDDKDHSLRFRWERRADRAWTLSFWVDDRHVWSFATAHEGILESTRSGEFQGSGDAAKILQRVFDDPEYGYHIIANQAYHGRPFGKDSHANFRMADFVIKGIRVRPI